LQLYAIFFLILSRLRLRPIF